MEEVIYYEVICPTITLNANNIIVAWCYRAAQPRGTRPGLCTGFGHSSIQNTHLSLCKAGEKIMQRVHIAAFKLQLSCTAQRLLSETPVTAPTVAVTVTALATHKQMHARQDT